MKIAVCFFGITRSLRHTRASIREHVLKPAQARGTTAVFAHFFDQAQIDNPRSGERGPLKPREYELLEYDRLILEEPGACLQHRRFDEIRSFGLGWLEHVQSLSNLVHQLHSLDCVTRAALEWAPDLVLFCRPDLLYFDSFGEPLDRAANAPSPSLFIPDWQRWEGGLNDRLAIAVGPGAAAAYGQRVDQALEYCRDSGGPLHPEKLLARTLRDLPVFDMDLRASRVRMDGRLKFESFDHWRTKARAQAVHDRVPEGLRRRALLGCIYLAQRLTLGDRYRGQFQGTGIPRPPAHTEDAQAGI